MPDELRIVAYGDPVPQGSMVGLRSRNPGREQIIVKPNNEKALRPWRKLIGAAALGVMGDELPWAGPMRVFLTFTLARPAAATNREHHVVAPDVDKLARAALDGLTGKAFEDDKLVVDLQARKRYVGHPDALKQPGVRITLVRLSAREQHEMGELALHGRDVLARRDDHEGGRRMRIATIPSLDELVARGKREVLADIASGRIPVTVATYSELHDYVDANEYGGLDDMCERDGLPFEDVIAALDQMQNVLDDWLRAGRPA